MFLCSELGGLIGGLVGGLLGGLLFGLQGGLLGDIVGGLLGGHQGGRLHKRQFIFEACLYNVLHVCILSILSSTIIIDALLHAQDLIGGSLLWDKLIISTFVDCRLPLSSFV